jgi:eukaryotic-like serine/threonine-protein kinase
MSGMSIRELFEQAQTLAQDRRAHYLDLHCADPAQRAQIERLLESAQASDIDAPLQRDPEQWARDIGEIARTPVQPMGASVGAFRIEALLGEGGSARVYRASRTVEGVAQTVALKVLRQGMWAEGSRRQFDRERRALVRLVHPNIAQFIDGGISDSGEAYIALEFVDGVQLLQYARERQLPFRERLRLMVEVTHAVSAAHRCLIVHRDLKPGNVLVARGGEVKLLDFGIAKLLEPEPDDSHPTQTQFRAFTPAYAAPEQRDGGVITTATDVYALGVLLGELLTGERLNGESGTTPSERVMATTMPGMLSASAKLTRRWLRGDLDNILLKATATLPEHRYETAAAFGEDIERLLAGQPVHAHPPSGWYRMRKFVVRHRGGVTTGLVIALTLLTSLAATIWQARAAQREAARAQAVSQFLVGLFRAAEDRLPRHQRPTPEQLIESAMTQLKQNHTMDNVTLAEIQATLGEVSRLSARYAQAQELLRAAAANLSHLPADDVRLLRIRVSEAQILQQLGESEKALTAIEALKPLLREHSAELLLSALAIEGAADISLSRIDAALDAARRRQQMAREIFGSEHPLALRASLSLGAMLNSAEHYRPALAELEPALARWNASKLPMDRDFMEAADAQAIALYGVGEMTDAEARFKELLTLQRSIYTEPHDIIAATLGSYAAVLSNAGKTDEAVSVHKESQAMLRAVYGPDHEQLVISHSQLGVAYARAFRLEESEVELRKAVAICTRTGMENVSCTRAHNNLGKTYYRQKRFPEAREQIAAAALRYRQIHGDDHVNVGIALSSLADVVLAERDFDESLKLSERALAIMESNGMSGSRDGILMRTTLVSALWLADRNDEALREIDRCIAAYDRILPGGLNRRTIMRIQRAQILEEMGRNDEARATAEEAIALGAKPSELPALTRQLLRDLSGRPDLYRDADPAP